LGKNREAFFSCDGDTSLGEGVINRMKTGMCQKNRMVGWGEEKIEETITSKSGKVAILGKRLKAISSKEHHRGNE